jgi:hypothetical protein
MATIDVLRAASRKYRFLDEFFVCVLRNKMKRSAVQAAYTVTASLSSITSKEASLIGKSLVGMLLTNQTGSAAIGELILTYPALTELDAEFTWFRPMLVAIADELMGKVAYGVKVSRECARCRPPRERARCRLRTPPRAHVLPTPPRTRSARATGTGAATY